MRQRLFLLLKIWLVTVCTFVLQKPVFMLFNSGSHPEVKGSDYLDVMLHGLPLDLSTAGYIVALPWLVLLVNWLWKSGAKAEKRTRFKRGKEKVKRSALSWTLVVYCVLVSTLVQLIFVADTVLYDFWGFKIDSTVFVYMDKPGDALASVSTWFVALCCFAFVALVVACAYIYIIAIPKESLRRPSHKWSAVVMVLVGGLLFLSIRGGVGTGSANVSNVYYSSNQYLNHSAVNPVFNMLYSVMHKQDFSKEFRFFDKEEAESIVKDYYLASPSRKKGEEHTDKLLKTNRPNILLVVWEGCGARMVGAIGGDKEVTPHLNQIASEGILFTHCYANSFRTDRGLLSIMSGWLGMPSASLMKNPNACNNLPGIARSLKGEGYKTDFWYGGDISFTNMGGYMLCNGFERTHSDGDFSLEERSYSKWGVVDGTLLDSVASEIINRPEGWGKPWMTTVLTLSSHEPWEVPYERLDGAKRNSFAYTDECLGRMISRLRASAQWSNLLVVIVPDHGVMAENEDNRSSMNVIHIPLVLTGGAVRDKGRRIGTVMNQSDLAATLLAQLGIDHSDFAFSRNVLGESYKHPSALHTSPIDATFIDEKGATTYDFQAKGVTFSSDAKGDSLRVRASKALLQVLYDKASELTKGHTNGTSLNKK